MPMVTIKIAKGSPVEIKRKLVQSVTESVSSSLDLKPELISVLIEEFERENWATGGELHSDKYGDGFGRKKMSIKEIYNFVQLTDNIATSGQPLEGEFALISKSSHKAVINIAMHNSDDAIANEGYIVTALGMSYFHIPVPFESPTIEHLRLFIKVMACFEGEKVWAHCAANYRVSAFMYQYLKLLHSISSKEAKSSIFDVWHPNDAWKGIMALSKKEIAL